MISNQIHYLSKEEVDVLLASIKKIKHKVIILLMLDCGLRVTEACSLRFADFDFKKRTLAVRSLKKRKGNKIRIIPLSDRLYRSFSDYLHQNKKLSLEPQNYVFPSSSKEGHISRKSIWSVLNTIKKNKGIENLHPHALRHTFATHHLGAGTSLAEIKEMLGHSSYDTTLIYADIPQDTLRQRIATVTAEPKPFWLQVYEKVRPPKKAKIINLDFQNNYFTVGRNDLLTQINLNANKGVNTILIGAIGTGKSHVLENLQTDKKILRMDDFEGVKKTLAQILLYLYNDKKTVLSILWKDFEKDEIKKRIQRENISQLCETITAAVEPKEYVLLIDDATKITPSGKKVLEKLKDTFCIITSARQVKSNDTSFIWNFEKIEIKNLPRKYAMQLINQASSGLEVENWELFRNHIWEQTNGNPRATIELIERYRKEPFLDNETVRSISHVGALKEIDLTWMIVIGLGVLTATRYMARELDQPALRFIGAAAMIVLLMYRPLMRSLKRQFV